jgi:hypothetical protein
MPRSKLVVEAALLEKGFRQDDNDHHFFVYWSIEGKKTRARTKTSHTKKMKDIDDRLLAEMARQCKLNRTQFIGLVDCPMSRREYEEVLRGQEELTSSAPADARPRAPKAGKKKNRRDG